MMPSKMIYKFNEESKPQTVFVYDMKLIHDADGVIQETYAIAWAVESAQWIIVPIWCLTPITKKKTLKEG